jgi:hypothetical protein
MRKALFCLRLLFLLASVAYAGASLFPVASGAALDGATKAYKCPEKYCGPQGPIWCGGVCRRPE